ncbi:dTDP-glucose 4,6-dehydratase [Alteromonas sp. KUL17]|uniref:PhoX family protein n=1 Tax=Alteromonas sp. KUL17 TaxID=2480796 RepID=UPI001037868B|nr:PhoX family phosphatase [Alteromonas sp. KUL17]TAP31124.1 PhoX family phosphatase [Alteromonas sp. KUL17]GEA01252.1 dTDP-glucose 4,6-dehydratase [Alteromonas sp. KUL17]
MSDHFQTILNRRMNRRLFLKKSALASTVAIAPSLSLPSFATSTMGSNTTSSFDFQEITHGISDQLVVAPGYDANVLIRWGEPLFTDAPAFDVNKQTPFAQERQFGYNNDYIGYLPLPAKNTEKRALLCINHEYSLPKMMFPDISAEKDLTLEHINIEQSSVGNSIVEIAMMNGEWKLVLDSPFNRRITARTTQIDIAGPARGHARMKTHADSSGTLVTGTLMNCAGGMTPWGTYLTCEENFNNVFTGSLPANHKEEKSYERYGINHRKSGWGEHDARFNVSQEPNEANRFGWVVEIDPLSPEKKPKKRSALGRFKHEGAESVIAPSGQLVVYMGDDAANEYLYKFVSTDSVDKTNIQNNLNLLDEGTLYVARFGESGGVLWMPLVHNTGPLTAKHGFFSQADVVINARMAADLLKATPLDRPEDVVPNASTGKVYVLLTNNTKRQQEHVDGVNPRAHNKYGQIVEITEPKGDFASTKSQWEMLVVAGDPNDKNVGAKWHKNTSDNGWFACPDNAVVDHNGRLWVSTDQGDIAYETGTNDGLWGLETEGEERGTGKMFLRCPEGAETTGPMFSDDGTSLFVAIQHPGVGSSESGRDSLHHPVNRWPDDDKNNPPRPSIVVVQKHDGKAIG